MASPTRYFRENRGARRELRAVAGGQWIERMQKREPAVCYSVASHYSELWYSSDPWMLVDRSPSVHEGKAWPPPVPHSRIIAIRVNGIGEFREIRERDFTVPQRCKNHD